MIKYDVCVYSNRTEWFLDEKRHRIGGPAIEFNIDTDQPIREKWFENDELHRLDGPAIVYWDWDGQDKYFIRGELLTATEYFSCTGMAPRELTGEQISQLLGYKVKVIT